MKVYVLEMGCYEQRTVWGIYDTPERAMAAAKGKWTRSTYTDEKGAQSVSWDNNLDWDAAASVMEYDLSIDGPERPADKATVQVYVPLNGKWAYLPESPEVLQLARDAAVFRDRHRKRGVWREPEATEVDRRIQVIASELGSETTS